MYMHFDVFLIITKCILLIQLVKCEIPHFHKLHSQPAIIAKKYDHFKISCELSMVHLRAKMSHRYRAFNFEQCCEIFKAYPTALKSSCLSTNQRDTAAWIRHNESTTMWR